MSARKPFTIALAGNPNVGKSTIFNALTGLHQKTGNWAGKTVACASGTFRFKALACPVVDLPGTYSLRARSEEEKIARDYIASGEADLLLTVCDATCPERGLRLLKQIRSLGERCPKHIILCVNLCDEAAKKGIVIDFKGLSGKLNIPVIPCTARNRHGLDELKNAIFEAYTIWEMEEDTAEGSGFIPDFSLEKLAVCSVSYENPAYLKKQKRIDRIMTGPFTGSAVMLLILLFLFWLTIAGANYPSSFLWKLFFRLEPMLAEGLTALGAPPWLTGAFVYGVYRTAAWVISVMLPPMAIFFPLFTLLEDLGYLPRAAFNMDCAFKKCSACGKQCLTMCFVNRLPSICRTAPF